jgi:hypothetical protein
MSAEQTYDLTDRIQAALGELQAQIQAAYPDASFQVLRGEDPPGFYLNAAVNVEDTDEVVDVFIDRLLELQIEEELPVYVIPLGPVVQASDSATGPPKFRSHLFGGALAATQ